MTLKKFLGIDSDVKTIKLNIIGIQTSIMRIQKKLNEISDELKRINK